MMALVRHHSKAGGGAGSPPLNLPLNVTGGDIRLKGYAGIRLQGAVRGLDFPHVIMYHTVEHRKK